MTREQFKEKYGKFSARVAEDIEFIFLQDKEALKSDKEIKERRYFVIYNPELSEQLMDYAKAFGSFDHMFFLIDPWNSCFYAYDDKGKRNIIKDIAELRDQFLERASMLDTLISKAGESDEK